MKLKPILTTFLIFVIVVILIGIILPLIGKPKSTPPVKVRVEIEGLSIAMKSFQSEYGFSPNGENSNVVRILAGDNQKRIVFLNFRRLAENPNMMFDPWKTPYQIQFFQETNFIISSAGKDKFFGTADDIVFNSSSNDFVKP